MIPAPTPPNESERLEALKRIRILDTDQDPEFENMVELAATIFSAPIALISLIDSQRQWFKARVGLDVPELPRNISFCGHAINDDDIFIVPDATQDERFSDNPLVTGELNLRFYAGVPVKSSDGHRLGTLCVIDRVPRDLSSKQQKILQYLGTQASYVLNGYAERMAHAVRADAEHQASSNFIAAVLDNIREGIVACDRNGKLTLFNRATREFHGIAVENLPPEEWADKYDLHAANGVDPLPLQEIPLFRAFSGETVRDAKMVIAPKNGKKRSIIANGQPILDAHGDKLGAVVSMYDQTEQILIEEKLFQAQKMEAIGQLTGGLAHDFNNLLTVINVNLELLQKEFEDDSGKLRQVTMALRAGQRGAELTKRLLAFARQQILQPRRVNLNKQIEEITPILGRTFSGVIDIRLDLAADLEPAFIDAVQFDSAIMNLATNARDAMGNGGRLTIKTRNVEIDEVNNADDVHRPDIAPGCYVMVEVADTGHGIPKEQLDRITEPFFTTKEVGQGTGLGLSMVLGFVQQSGGHFSVNSEEGCGATVSLFFNPADPAASEFHQTESAGTVRSKTDGNSAERRTVLVVDDDSDVCKVVIMQLKSLGYAHLSAMDGPSAIDVIRRSDDIDLMMTDMMMPGGMTGVDLARKARLIRPGLKVLITSGYPDASKECSALSMAGFEFIAKPYTFTELSRTLARMLT